MVGDMEADMQGDTPTARVGHEQPGPDLDILLARVERARIRIDKF